MTEKNNQWFEGSDDADLVKDYNDMFGNKKSPSDLPCDEERKNEGGLHIDI